MKICNKCSKEVKGNCFSINKHDKDMNLIDQVWFCKVCGMNVIRTNRACCVKCGKEFLVVDMEHFICGFERKCGWYCKPCFKVYAN